MADEDCLGFLDKCQSKENDDSQAPKEPREENKSSVDGGGLQPESTDPSRSILIEPSMTTTAATTSSPSSSLSSSASQDEMSNNNINSVDCNLPGSENNTTKTHQVRETNKNDTKQVKTTTTSSSSSHFYKTKTSHPQNNGEEGSRKINLARRNGNIPPTSFSSSSHQQINTMNGREYAQVVRAWLWQYHQWNSMCAFSMMLPYYAMATFPYYTANNYHASSLGGRSPSNSGGGPSFASGPNAGAAVNNNHHQMGAAAAAPHDGGRANQSPPPQTPQQNFRATEYMIPSLWKRILAELVDFVLLFYIKLMVSMLVMKHMGYIDLEKYDLEYNWFVTMDEFDLSKVFHFTSEVILFELLNRISITIVETMCLRRGIGVVGGATPGKRLLGMKVVSCTDITDLGNGRIQVTPARDIGLYSALLRSILKNFTIAFFFPACLTVFFFDHNRAAYDVLAGSIVVQPVEEAAGEL